jgi:hypothetical protein
MLAYIASENGVLIRPPRRSIIRAFGFVMTFLPSPLHTRRIVRRRCCASSWLSNSRSMVQVVTRAAAILSAKVWASSPTPKSVADVRLR